MAGDWIKLPRIILADKTLTASAKLVYAAILDRIGTNGRAWPGTRLLAQETGMDRKTVRLSIGQLESARFLAVERYGNGRRQYYRLGETGGETGPLCTVHKPGEKLDRGRNGTGPVLPQSGGETGPEAGEKCPHNQKTKNLKKKQIGARPAHPDHKPFVEWWCKTYQETFGTKYVFAGAKDGQLVGDLLRKTGGLAALQAAAENMLADPWGRDKADIGLLSSKLNNWLKPARASPARHTPARTTETYDDLIQDFPDEQAPAGPSERDEAATD